MAGPNRLRSGSRASTAVTVLSGPSWQRQPGLGNPCMPRQDLAAIAMCSGISQIGVKGIEFGWNGIS